MAKPDAEELRELYKEHIAQGTLVLCDGLKSYHFYRRVATKYLNRYNALFASAYRKTGALAEPLLKTLSAVSSTDYYHSNKAVKEMGLLII